jgi:hypothetical protein
MSMRKYFSVLIIFLIVLSCNTDHGLAPLQAKLKATVYFRGIPPDNTQGIYLVVMPQFPPHAINELFHSPNSLPIGVDSVKTEIDLPLGHYDAVSLWWYSTETKSNLADVIALPLDANNYLVPMSFDLTRENPQAQVDLYASWDRVNRNASIEGTIHFNGPFPANTLATAIAAYRSQPQNGLEYVLLLKSIDFTVSQNPYHFVLPVRNGNIDYIAVFWLPEKANLTDFRTIGIYKDPINPDQAGKILVKAGQKLTGIDIQADWSLAK